MVRDIDETDRKILCMMSENPELSQTEISEKLSISQPAVSARIRKLEDKGLLSRIVGTDISKAQLYLAKVGITTNQVEGLLRSFENCPLYLNCFLTSGRHNMTCFLMGEDMKSVMSCVDTHFRQNPAIKSMECDLVMNPTKSLIVPVKPQMEKKNQSPCGKICRTCTFYTSERCLGCPASNYYKGKLL